MKKIKNPNVAIELTKEEALKLGIDPTVNNQSGEMKTTGPYQICKSFKALCLSKTYDKSKMYTEVKEVVLYGLRTMSNPKQGGYELEGYVSIKGKKYSSFTSSQLFQVDGNLINVSTIQARIK